MLVSDVEYRRVRVGDYIPDVFCLIFVKIPLGMELVSDTILIEELWGHLQVSELSLVIMVVTHYNG